MSNYEKLTKMQVDGINAMRGDLEDGFTCEKCLDKGYIAKSDGINIFCETCECMARRKAIRSAKKSGASELLRKYSFDNYVKEERWQEAIFSKATKFAEINSGLWFIGGQIGSGKTAISIAILNRLLERGLECRYYIWKNLVTELNSLLVDDNSGYDYKMKELSTIPVLYLDDFMRTEPSKAEIEYAYRIINARYMATLSGKEVITLISSQKQLRKLMSIDEAIASRICEMGGNFITSIDDNPKFNFRMRLFSQKMND